MAPSQRKLVGPETSFSYKLFTKVENLEIPTSESPQKQRQIYIKMGILSQMKGSAYMEMGHTKLLAAVFGPRELSKLPRKSCLGSVQCEVKYAPFGFEHEDASEISKKEKIYSMALKKALQPVICRNEFTNFQIDIFVYVLQDDGCVLSSAINCAGVALIDGGVAMYDIITAATVGIHNQITFVDPTYIEECYCTNGNEEDEFGIVVLSRLESHYQTSDCFQVGCMTFDTLKKINGVALKRNQDISKNFRQVLVQKIKANTNAEKGDIIF